MQLKWQEVKYPDNDEISHVASVEGMPYTFEIREITDDMRGEIIISKDHKYITFVFTGDTVMFAYSDESIEMCKSKALESLGNMLIQAGRAVLDIDREIKDKSRGITPRQPWS